ncbi:MAG TPA: acyl-CoA dehydratase activase [Desulfatirhabdiaceae bacterium]|nr:acyl-CoA dehydratase activase [Desulfatirhabdiaceae bacterium]
MITAGIDIGSITAKAAVMNDQGLMDYKVIPTGFNAKQAGEEIFEHILCGLGLNPSVVEGVVSTGYGRKSVAFAQKAVTEITCHATGVVYLNPAIRSIIDIGGQDSKVILLDETGKVRDFAMNDKCAAGTGRFIEVMARALHVELDVFGPMSLQADNPAAISSLCTVFAESEVISLISRGESRENIIAGIHESIAARIIAMMGRIGWRPPVMMTGGVARNVGLVQALENRLACQVLVSEYAQVTGAIGAALIARGSHHMEGP